jgi:KDO2-lipid IV(A) lauroyltransferase
MFMSRMICCLPHSFLMSLGKGLGILYYKFIKKQRQLALRQIRRSLDISEAEAERTIRDSFINMGRNFLEMLYMPHLSKENFTDYIEIDHLDRLKAALAEKHGVVILTGHVGNWEWLSAAFTFSGLPVTAIAKPQPNEQYTRVLNDLRATVGVEIFSRGTSELLAAARALKKGKILGFLADQDAGPGGAFIDFFGRPAATPMGPAVFSKKFNSPVLPAFILRQPNGRHKVVIGEVMRYEDTGDSDRDLFSITEKMTRILEQIIRENPTQWLWFQKRWNTPPDEKKERHHVIKSEGAEHE